MDYGEHCSACGRLDFLPLDCRKCGQVFCTEHRVHSCGAAAPREAAKSVDASPARAGSGKSATKTALNPASKAGPASKTSTTSKTSPAPKTSEPARPPARPAANAEKPAAKRGTRLGSGPVKGERALAALARLKNLVGGTGSAKKPVRGPTPEQRRTAVGDVRVAQGDRVYLEIERPSAEVRNTLTGEVTQRPPKTVWMFFARDQNAGQILDRATKQLNVAHGALERAGERAGEPVDAHCEAPSLEGGKLMLVAAP